MPPIQTDADVAVSNTIRVVVDALFERDGEALVREAVRAIMFDMVKRSIKSKVENAVIKNQKEHPEIGDWLVEIARELRSGADSPSPAPPPGHPTTLVE
jgi:hypothetical protein